MDAETYADLLPWLVFIVIDRKSGLGVAWAGGCAAATGVLLRLWAYWHGRRAPAASLAVAVFCASWVAALLVPWWDDQLSMSRSAAVLALSVLAFLSVRFNPLSDAYTSAQVAPGALGHPGFHRVNVEVTMAWGIGALLVSVSFAAGDLDKGPVGLTILSWVVPLVLAAATILWVARRWERYCLELEERPASQLSEATVTPFPPRGWDDTADAVIRRLPLRGRGNL